MRASLLSARLSSPAGIAQSQTAESVPAGPFLLHFLPLFQGGREFAFPCDASGRVDLDAMTAPVRNNYLYARAMLGREFTCPSVRCIRPEPPADDRLATFAPIRHRGA